MYDIFLAETDDDYAAAAELFLQYAQELPIALDFQHFEEELQQLKIIYAAEKGGIILCKKNNLYIGCAGIRKFDDETGELKRMWTDPAFRGLGIGANIIKAAITLATQKKYKSIVLDTLNHMETAISLYKQAGFKQIEPYYFNPYKNALYFKKIIE